MWGEIDSKIAKSKINDKQKKKREKTKDKFEASQAPNQTNNTTYSNNNNNWRERAMQSIKCKQAVANISILSLKARLFFILRQIV